MTDRRRHYVREDDDWDLPKKKEKVEKWKSVSGGGERENGVERDVLVVAGALTFRMHFTPW